MPQQTVQHEKVYSLRQPPLSCHGPLKSKLSIQQHIFTIVNCQPCGKSTTYAKPERNAKSASWLLDVVAASELLTSQLIYFSIFTNTKQNISILLPNQKSISSNKKCSIAAMSCYTNLGFLLWLYKYYSINQYCISNMKTFFFHCQKYFLFVS